MAYDRLLERLYLADEGWIIKGATALLARDIGVRGTIDIDLYREVAREIAAADLREAAALDLGDWFRFEIGPPRPLADTGGVRLAVKAFVGNAEWAAFHVDLVGEDLRMTGDPEDVPPLARVVMPDVEQHGYRAYPLIDHAADKTCAIFERHGAAGTPSTRYRDLVDLVAIVLAAAVEAEPQMTALRSEAQRRGLRSPGRFAVPDRGLCNLAMRPEAGRSLLPMARTLDEAIATVTPFLDPLLDGTARGRWDQLNAWWTSLRVVDDSTYDDERCWRPPFQRAHSLAD